MMRLLGLAASLLFLLRVARADPPQPPTPVQQRPARNKARKSRAAKTVRPRAKPRPKFLAAGRWLPEVREALDRLIEERGTGSRGYSAEEPPVAVISWDDVATAHHAGENLFYRLVTRAEFKFDDKFWTLLPVVYGRERVRAGYQVFSPLPRSVWDQQPEYWMYRKAFFGCYQSICREQGRKACARWLVTLLTGFAEADLRRLAGEAVVDSLRGQFGQESDGDSPEDPAPVKVKVGLRKIPEMEDLILKLKKHGFDVWVLSVSDQWSLEASSALYGVDPSRAVGVRAKAIDGRVTGDVQEPVPYGDGKAEAVSTFIGAPPALIVGDADDDELLKFGSGLRIKVMGQDRQTGFERERGWLIQPPFSPF